MFLIFFYLYFCILFLFVFQILYFVFVFIKEMENQKSKIERMIYRITEFEPSEELGSEIIEAPATEDEEVSQITVLEVHELAL